MPESMSFNRALVEKYDRPGPRYTSYPTAPQFHGAFAADDYRAAARRSNHPADGSPAKPLHNASERSESWPACSDSTF